MEQDLKLFLPFTEIGWGNAHVMDASGNRIDCQIFGNITLVEDEIFVHCYEFGGGAGDYIDTQNSLTPLGGNHTEFTIALWVKTASVSTAILSKKTGNGKGPYRQGEVLFLVDNNRNIGLFGNGDNHNISTQSLDTGWNHVAVTQSNGMNTVYVNGKPSESKPGLLIADNTDTVFQIGLNVGNAPGQKNPVNFKGRMADLRIYERALSAADIDWLANGKKYLSVYESLGNMRAFILEDDNWNFQYEEEVYKLMKIQGPPSQQKFILSEVLDALNAVLQGCTLFLKEYPLLAKAIGICSSWIVAGVKDYMAKPTNKPELNKEFAKYEEAYKEAVQKTIMIIDTLRGDLSPEGKPTNIMLHWNDTITSQNVDYSPADIYINPFPAQGHTGWDPASDAAQISFKKEIWRYMITNLCTYEAFSYDDQVDTDRLNVDKVINYLRSNKGVFAIAANSFIDAYHINYGSINATGSNNKLDDDVCDFLFQNTFPNDEYIIRSNAFFKWEEFFYLGDPKDPNVSKWKNFIIESDRQRAWTSHLLFVDGG